MDRFRLIEERLARIIDRTPQGVAIIVSIAVLCAAPIIWVARVHARSGSADRASTSGETRPTAEAVAQSKLGDYPISHAPVLRVVITPRGFEPNQVSIASGPFALVVINGSPLIEASLSLERETGERLHDENLPVGKNRWGGLFNLTPGKYVMTDPNRPDRILRLTVTPH